MNGKITDYCFAVGVREVNQLISEGWVPHGSAFFYVEPAMHYDSILRLEAEVCQPMVKHDNKGK